MAADPFSDILELADAQSVVSGGFTAGARWAIRFPPPRKLKFFAVVRGSCRLHLDGEKDPVRIEAGDAFMLSAPRPFLLWNGSPGRPIDSGSVFTPGSGAIARVGKGDDFFLLGGHVELDRQSGGLVSDVLPPLIHVRAGSPRASTLQWLLDQLVRERTADLPGAGVATSQLAQLMFVQILRAHLSESESFSASWLKTLRDVRLAPALRLMHREPARDWQLEELAKAAGMSRTTFAVRFKDAAGVPPLAYLTHWRMRLAERALRKEDATIAELATTLGYASESAFSNAFKRIVGVAPKRFRETSRASDARALELQPELEEP